MLASEIGRGAIVGGVRVIRKSFVTQDRRRMVVLHLENGKTRTCLPDADIHVTHTRRLELPAGVVRAPKRTEIIPAVQERQTPRGNDRRGLSTTRRTS